MPVLPVGVCRQSELYVFFMGNTVVMFVWLTDELELPGSIAISVECQTAVQPAVTLHHVLQLQCPFARFVRLKKTYDVVDVGITVFHYFNLVTFIEQPLAVVFIGFVKKANHQKANSIQANADSETVHIVLYNSMFKWSIMLIIYIPTFYILLSNCANIRFLTSKLAWQSGNVFFAWLTMCSRRGTVKETQHSYGNYLCM